MCLKEIFAIYLNLDGKVCKRCLYYDQCLVRSYLNIAKLPFFILKYFKRPTSLYKA